MNLKIPKLRYIAIKRSKIKDKLESSKKTASRCTEGILLRLLANFSGEALQTKRQWNDIFKLLKENKNKTYQLRFQINNLILHLKEQDKEGVNPKLEGEG